jgi:hypothetical protein
LAKKPLLDLVERIMGLGKSVVNNVVKCTGKRGALRGIEGKLRTD